jgi:intraflagellar transport protein 74
VASHSSQVGSQTPTYLIQQEHAALLQRNEAQKRRVDEVLTERLALEEKTRKAGGSDLGE